MALPTFRTSSSASSLRFATSASASACRSRERSVGAVRPQSPSSAARAASTARSTSASLAMATFASGSPVAGSDSSLSSPPDGSEDSPLMKSRYSRSVATAIGGTLAKVGRRELLGEQPLETSRIAVDPLAADVVAGGVRRDVRAPQRVGDEAGELLPALPRPERPLHRVLDRGLLGAAARVDEEGRVPAHVGERQDRLLDAPRDLLVIRHA